jgi:hypothetical protein
VGDDQPEHRSLGRRQALGGFGGVQAWATQIEEAPACGLLPHCGPCHAHATRPRTSPDGGDPAASALVRQDRSVPQPAVGTEKGEVSIRLRPSQRLAGVPGLEPRLTEPESVVLPITPYPTGLFDLPIASASGSLADVRGYSRTRSGEAVATLASVGRDARSVEHTARIVSRMWNERTG